MERVDENICRQATPIGEVQPKARSHQRVDSPKADSLDSNVSARQEDLTMLREQMEILRNRLCLLGEKDRALMRMYLENGSSIRQLAKLTGTNRANISRKVRKITRRLLDERFVICLHKRRAMTPFEFSVARDSFIKGLSFREISQRKRVSYHSIRKTMKNIKRVIDNGNIYTGKKL